MQAIRLSDIVWAEAILVMEHQHRQRILADFPGESHLKLVHVLDISDDYQFMDDELIVLIWSAFEWMVRIGAPLFLRTDPELVLYGRYVIPKRLLDEGFLFRFRELEPALRVLCS